MFYPKLKLLSYCSQIMLRLVPISPYHISRKKKLSRIWTKGRCRKKYYVMNTVNKYVVFCIHFYRIHTKYRKASLPDVKKWKNRPFFVYFKTNAISLSSGLRYRRMLAFWRRDCILWPMSCWFICCLHRTDTILLSSAGNVYVNQK